MDECEHNDTDVVGPGSVANLRQQVLNEVRTLLDWCCDGSQTQDMLSFERSLAGRLALLARLLIALFLAARHDALDLRPWLNQGYQVVKARADRQLKTRWGTVRYVRAYLKHKTRSIRCFPLDQVLGITSDGFSPWLMSIAARLATRMSYAATVRVMSWFCQVRLSEESIEHLVYGLGRLAPAYMQECPMPDEEGEVLVIEIDGKAAPTATDAEMTKRRQPRRTHPKACSCGCQRHRGRSARQQRGRQRRRKKGDKSKNGRSATIVVMYTLRKSPDGRLHGPINKKVWAQFGPRQAAMQWARDQATRRGFGPQTDKTVQIVMDGEICLKDGMTQLFPHAILTLDVRHAQEYLWDVGRAFYAEGSLELSWFVEGLIEFLMTGHAAELVDELAVERDKVPLRGPGTKAKRQALAGAIQYLRPRIAMMDYAQWLDRDLVIATGIVEGAARYVIGERLDCSGMRWLIPGAQAVLQLRCIELNDDWDDFYNWVQGETQSYAQQRGSYRIRPPASNSRAKAA